MIEFFHYPTHILQEEQKDIADWLKDLAALHNQKIKRLSYSFISNEQLLNINKQYLQHNYFTDIITFDYSVGSSVAGEVFISTEQVRIQSKELSVPEKEELLRVMAHGLLHLIGFKDKTTEEKLQMRAEEEKALTLHAQKSDL